jgi:hypothetical protein
MVEAAAQSRAFSKKLSVVPPGRGSGFARPVPFSCSRPNLQAMTNPDITAMEARSRNHSETPRRVLFVLGPGRARRWRCLRLQRCSAPPASIPSTLRRWPPAGSARWPTAIWPCTRCSCWRSVPRLTPSCARGWCTRGCGRCRQHSRSDRRGSPLGRFWAQCGPPARAPARS